MAKAGATSAASANHSGEIRLGFVPLLDAAPLILAHELGYFADEGLRVSLHRQIGWGNVRDKLVYGHLHASHAPVGMPPASLLDRERFPESLVSLMGLGTGGDAITLSWRLVGAGIDSPAALARSAGWRRSDQPAAFAHVFSCSVHHYLLREWLAGGGVDPDRDVRLCVLPPAQMTGHMAAGHLDGFCAGEPWNTLAEREGSGKVVAHTADLVPAHPDKVLAVRRRWLDANRDVAAALVRAVLRGCAFCDDPAGLPRLAEFLARPAYIGLPAELLLRSLLADRPSGATGSAESGKSSPDRRGDRLRSCAAGATFPSATHAGWLLSMMARWGHLPAAADAAEIARRSVDAGPYREAAAKVGVDCPPHDAPPMRLREGWFELDQPPPLARREAAAERW